MEPDEWNGKKIEQLGLVIYTLKWITRHCGSVLQKMDP